MTPMTNKALENLPDIPSLEQVQGKIDGNGWILLGCLPIVSTAIWWWVKGEAAVSLGIIVTIIAAMYFADYLTYGEATASQDGLSYKRQSRNKYIAWADVTDVHTAPIKHGSKIEISSNTTTIKFPVTSSVYTARFEASIWQHLRRYGKAENLILSDNALSIWSPIPEDIPEEMDYFDDVPDDVGIPTRYELRADHILQEYVNLSPRHMKYIEEKNIQNPMVIRWADVVDAKFDSLPQDYDDGCFVIISIDKTMHIVDWSTDTGDYSRDIAYVRFLLATIRRARETQNKPAIPIPEGMRKVCDVKLPTEL